jgi:hypothetical protein
VISPLLSNVYLNEVDRMLERAKEVTRQGRWDAVSHATGSSNEFGDTWHVPDSAKATAGSGGVAHGSTVRSGSLTSTG